MVRGARKTDILPRISDEQITSSTETTTANQLASANRQNMTQNPDERPENTTLVLKTRWEAQPEPEVKQTTPGPKVGGGQGRQDHATRGHLPTPTATKKKINFYLSSFCKLEDAANITPVPTAQKPVASPTNLSQKQLLTAKYYQTGQRPSRRRRGEETGQEKMDQPGLGRKRTKNGGESNEIGKNNKTELKLTIGTVPFGIWHRNVATIRKGRGVETSVES